MVQTGIASKFKVNREMDAHERTHPLWTDRSQQFSPDESLALIRFNSTFIEFVDRGFRQRGMPGALGSGVICILIAVVMLVSPYFLFKGGVFEDISSVRDVVVLIVIALTLFAFPSAFIIFYRIARNSFFAYTHYPIRFNRKNRKVYFFLHNGPGGVVSVDWEDPNVYFHVGRGEGIKYLRDLRCHVLDGYMVKQTFAIGHYWWHENSIRKFWEFIRRYMEMGPEQCFDHPADEYISLSSEMSFENCINHAYFMGPIDFIKIGRLLYPFYVVIAAGRWLAMKTCKKPVWPPEVEQACAIDADDPHRLAEPKISGEFDTPESIERARQAFIERERWEKDVF